MQLQDAINLVLSAAFLVIIIWGVKKTVAAKKDIPRLISLLPADLQKIVQDAAKFGSEFVEKIDENGELSKYINTEIIPKAEAKLALAVDFAVEYLEGVFKANGYTIDIDQEALKNLIQKYVWDNPELFPKKENPTP